ncbi:MAG: response regulator [Deltaproteobacteria bacterium]|nr:response regulator [Deltaproteobacteria bacterium]
MTKKLLLADDSITIQKVIGIIFATEDYQLLVCDDGNKAFDKALEEYPDLVIADVSMPGRDGFELCQAIKSEPRLAHTSVLLLPGTFDPFDENRARTVGADGWLTKPFESQALLDKVAQLLETVPVRLAATEEPSFAEAPELVVEGQKPVVDEVTLGLDEVEESAAESIAEESPDDIWDAVSFEEEDLQPSAEILSDTEEFTVIERLTEELSAASVAAPSFEPTEELPLAGSFAAEDRAEEEAVEFAAADEPLELVEGAGPVADEPLELTEEVAAEPVADEPLELTEEAVEELVIDEPLELAEEAVAEPVVDAPLELTEETIVAAGEEFSDAAEGFVTEDSLAGSEFVADDLDVDLPVGEPLSEGALEDEEEILDLGEEDILEEGFSDTAAEAAEFVAEPAAELTEEAPETEAAADVIVAEAAEEESYGFEEPPVAEDSEPAAATVVEESFVAPVAEVEIAPQPVAAEDEGFYFDATDAEEEIEDSFDVPAAAFAAELPVAEAEKVSLTERLSQQLGELPEDELKELIAKVAGPIIEKLANEMLEQIAWEVVPDLAESMIREEIRKIRQGAE